MVPVESLCQDGLVYLWQREVEVFKAEFLAAEVDPCFKNFRDQIAVS